MLLRTEIPGTNFPGRIRSGERMVSGVKVPRSKISIERIGRGPIRAFTPGSELAQEGQKGLVLPRP